MRSDDDGRSIDDAALAAAERKLLAAREAWHAERGEVPPPHEAPDPVKEAERKFLAAREAGKTGRV
jgi:hypothetical protein